MLGENYKRKDVLHVITVCYTNHGPPYNVALLFNFQGYIRHARKREDMFSEDRISVIFGNMEEIYEFSQRFLEKIEISFVKEKPYHSQLGHCFLECVSILIKCLYKTYFER